MKRLSKFSVTAAVALAASSAYAQTSVYNFETLYDTNNVPDPAGTYPDDFRPNGGGATVTQSTTGLTGGDTNSMEFTQVAGATFTGALTQIIPEIIDDPNTVAISADVTIPATGNFTGSFARMGISEFGNNPDAGMGLQVQTNANSEVNIDLPAGTYHLTIPLIALNNPVTFDTDVPFSSCFGSDPNSQLTATTSFEFYFNKAATSALTAYLDNVVAIGPSTDGTWASAGGGSWGTTGKWTGGVPQFALDTANLTSSITANSTLTLDGNRSLGTLNISNSSFDYTIAAGSGGTLTLDAGGSNTSTITDSAGTHTISAPVYLNTNTVITVNNTADALNMTGPISGINGITLQGNGTLVMSGSNNYVIGGTTISSGTLIVANSSGSATSGANVNLNGGTLASASASLIASLNAGSPSSPAGNGFIAGEVIAGSSANTIAPGGIGSAGTLSIGGGLTTTSSTTLSFQLGTASSEVTNGSLLVITGGTVSIASGTTLSFTGTPVGGDDYRLISAPVSGGLVGGISDANFVLPTAPVGLGFTLSNNGVDPGYIDLVVSGGPPKLTWNDASADNLWNTTSSNWNNGSATTTYSNPSNVTFNDNNGGNYTVSLNTTVTPASVTVNNSSGNYSITGTGSIVGAPALTKSGTGTITIGTKGSSFGAVSVTAGLLRLGASSGLATATSLSVSGSGQFDVNNNHVLIDYAGGSDPIASIAALLTSGFNGGKWNGPGIISSAAAVTAGYGLGYADSADTGNPASLASGNIEIKYTLLGDTNLDGVVNAVDFGILAANFNKGVSRWDQGDFNYDNVVSAIDFGELAANFNKGASGASIGPSALSDPALVAFAEANGLMADVPEPASIAFLAAAMAATLTPATPGFVI